jgi:hypothetical protein
VPQVRQSVPGPKMICFDCFFFPRLDLLLDMAETKNYEGLRPDFLWSLVALAHIMRLSLLKAAHAAVGECHVAGNPGRPSFAAHVRFGERGAPVPF